MRANQEPNGLSVQTRERNLQRLRDQSFDLLVIGGGINGAAIARDAAMRGMRVVLVEKGDFASGTSSKSSKLIHGGIRYLKQRDLRLVRVACRERDLLRRHLAPHLVQPLAFLYPVYPGYNPNLLMLGAGMWLYDLLAIFRNIKMHRMLGPKRVLQVEPGLRAQGLRGAGLYYDCITDDARLTLETVLAAHEEGATVANYVEVKQFLKENTHIVGAVVSDRFGSTPIEVRARCVVNSTGPWGDIVRRLDDPSAAPCLRLTKGVHIIVPRERVGNTLAVVMHSPRDQRVMFVIPWDTHAIIGTTDTDFQGSRDKVEAEPQDIDYILEAANWFFPRANLTPADVVGTYAGLRALVAQAGAEHASDVSREEEIFEAPSGLITLGGGKLTTHRLVAREIVDLVARRLGVGKPSVTGTKPLPGGSADPTEILARLTAANGLKQLRPEQLAHLTYRYGSRAPEVVGLAQLKGELERSVVSGLPDIWAEAEFAAQFEMAIEPEDFLLRRTNVGLKVPRMLSQLADILRETIRKIGVSGTP